MRRMMALAELLPDVDVPRDIVVRGLVQDSRTIEPGDAFVAIAGFGAHGLNFVEQARQKGASAILYEPRRRRKWTCRATPSPCPACARAWARWPTASTPSRRAT